jgi:hypothetical protein
MEKRQREETTGREKIRNKNKYRKLIKQNKKNKTYQ